MAHSSVQFNQSMNQERTIKRISNIIKDQSHSATRNIYYLPSGRSRAFNGNKRFIDSFYTFAIKTINTNYMR